MNTYTIELSNGTETNYEGGCTLTQVIYRLRNLELHPNGFHLVKVELETKLKKSR